MSFRAATRALTLAAAGLFALLGVVLFALPEWSAEHFAWSVSPFVAMTMGGWCLGNAMFACSVAVAERWAVAYPAALYLAAFSVLQLVVLIAFRDRLRLAHPVAWVYVAALVVGAAAGLAARFGFVPRRLSAEPAAEPRMPGLLRIGVVLFVLLVAVLAVGGARARLGGLSSEGLIFPEPLSLFTIRAFAAFFGALAIGALPLAWARSAEPVLHVARCGLALIVPILVAAAVHIDAFDLRNRPGGWLYLGAYILVGVTAAAALARYGRGPRVSRTTPRRPAPLTS